MRHSIDEAFDIDYLELLRLITSLPRGDVVSITHRVMRECAKAMLESTFDRVSDTDVKNLISMICSRANVDATFDVLNNTYTLVKL